MLSIKNLVFKERPVRNRPATEPVTLKVYNIKLSFDIWLVLYIVINLFLRVGNKNNPCIRATQENSIENSVQDSLPYIRIPNGSCELFLAYPKLPCILHVV